MVRVTIPYGHREISFTIPEKNFVEVLNPNVIELPPDEVKVIEKALNNPVGTERLEKIARRGGKTVIICDDMTRPTPAYKILPPLLRHLNKAGIPNRDIKIVMALGTHRPMTREEMAQKVGVKVLRQVEVVNSEFSDKEKLIDLGVAPGGVRVWIDRAVVEGDIKIGVGTILPHPVAGWGGGGKIVYPGVAGEETVRAFHLQYGRMPRGFFGMEKSPIRENMEKWVDTLGLDFIVNAIVTPDRRIYNVVAGHYISAHRVGVRFAKEVYGVKAKEKADIVIVGSYPADLDFWQAGKALCSGELLTKDGGSLILVTPCYEGIGPHKFLADYIGDDEPERLLEETLQGRVEDPVAVSGAVALGRMRKRIKIGVISDGLSVNHVQRMKFEHYENVEEALRTKLDEYGEEAKASVIPYGAEIYPYL